MLRSMGNAIIITAKENKIAERSTKTYLIAAQPWDQDSNPKRNMFEEKLGNSDVEGKPTSLCVNAKNKLCLSICENHKPWCKSHRA